MYYVIERSVAIVKPRQPCLDWINSTLSYALTLNAIRIDPQAYLVPENFEIEDCINFIDEKFLDIFHLELASWTDDETLWPQNLSLKVFWEWFDVEISLSVLDITDKDHNPDDTIH